MQRITWYVLLAVVALVAPNAGRAQAPRAQAPQATVRELATIEGDTVGDFVLLPSRRALLYVSLPDEDSTFIYDIATKRRTLLGTNMPPGHVSPQGDRLAFTRPSEDRTQRFVWTMPIDPTTGLATGQAQRVSLRSFSGFAPMFSPDGEMLAFNSLRSDGTRDLILVPSTGGAERVVANYSGRRPGFVWSADGQSLYVQNSENAVERVSVAGGRRETLVPRTLNPAGGAMGFSPDMRVAFFHQSPDRFFYRTASGVEGEISVALPPLDAGGGYTLALDSSMRYAMMTHVWNQHVRILDLTTGQSRDLLPSNVRTSAPAWSPDGKRLAVLTGSGSHYDIMVVNADGSSQRRYPMPMHLDGSAGVAGVWETPWSPDGRFLAFRAKAESDARKVAPGPDDRGQLALLDVNTGQTRVLTTSSAPVGFGRFVWRSDGKAIRAMKRAEAPWVSPSRYSVVEIPLNGPERQLRDISAEFPEATPPFLFVSDRAVVVTVTAAKMTERFLVPLDGGAARRLPDPGIEPGFRAGGPGLAAGNQLFLGLIDAKGQGRVVKIVSTNGAPTRTLSVPFNGQNRVFHPDGKQVIAVGKGTGDSVSKFFLVPLDGSPTRVIGEISRGTGGLLAPSPDGKLLAYTADGSTTTKIFEIDFNPALQAIMKR